MKGFSIFFSLRGDFDQQVELLAAELESAWLEGPHQFDELRVALPARLRRLFRQCVVARAEDRNPPDLGSSEGSSAYPPSMAEGTSTAPSAARPQGPFLRRSDRVVAESVVPAFTRVRMQLGLSLVDLAELARKERREISKSTIWRIEAGAVVPNRDHAEALAAAMRLPVDTIQALLSNEAPEAQAGHVVEL